jgi:hypothetical protein
MARLPYTQGTRAYQAAQAVLRGEADNQKIAADIRLNLKTVQNVRSMINRLRKIGAIPMGNITGPGVRIITSEPPPAKPPPVVRLPIREAVPEQPARQEGREVTEGNGRESSQEGHGRESLGKKSSPSRTLGKDLREAREGMYLVKDS